MKTAQLPSQYDYGGYEQNLDNPQWNQTGLLPGMAPVEPPAKAPSWLLPAGLVAGGLTGAALLRGGWRGLKGIGAKLRGARPAAAAAPRSAEVIQRELATAYPTQNFGDVAKMSSAQLAQDLRQFAHR